MARTWKLFDPVSGRYRLAREGRSCDSAEMAEMAADWCAEFPIVSIEDPLDQEDWSGWAALTRRLLQ